MTTSLPRQQPRRAGRPRTARRDTTPPEATGTDPSALRSSGAAVVAVKKIFAAETGNFFLLLGATLFLVTFGLVMVLSSSAVSSCVM